MALDKATLSASLKTFFDSMDEAPSTNQDLADAFADAVDVFVKSGTVSTTVSVVDPVSETLTGTGTGSVT